MCLLRKGSITSAVFPNLRPGRLQNKLIENDFYFSVATFNEAVTGINCIWPPEERDKPDLGAELGQVLVENAGHFSNNATI